MFVPLRVWQSVNRFGGLDNVEYGNSWFKVITSEHDFNYISKHMRWIAYQILVEILRIDENFTREKIMSWTYNIDKIDKLINRINILIQIFTDLLNRSNENSILAHLNENKFSDYLEIHFCFKFLISLCNNWKEFQDYLRVQHNRIRSTNILLNIIALTRVCLKSLKHELALKIHLILFFLFQDMILMNKLFNTN